MGDIKKKKVIGIIGGMGPMATYDLAQKIISNTEANCDQEHIHVIIDCNTDIPDRTEAILYGGEDPTPELIKSAVMLEGNGADFLIIPCNTAHYFFNEISEAVNVPVINMPEETAKYLNERGIKRAAVLATEGTVKSGVYEEALKQLGIEAIYPGDSGQKTINKMIYDHVKANDFDFSSIIHTPRNEKESELEKLLSDLEGKGAEVLVLACTELPIAFQVIREKQSLTLLGRDIGEVLVDPGEILARVAIIRAGYRTV